MSNYEPDSIDKSILLILQGDLDDSRQPYLKIAMNLGITEDEVFKRVKNMIDEGIIRRLGAMIRHIEAGIGFNGMVVWVTPPDHVDNVGRLFASFPEVTHCYERPPFGKKGANLFTMVHADSEQACIEIIKKMSKASGVKDYEILFSERELKKVSMTYFDDSE
ncbi:MAG: Lrp/AsnC family transcriptional regulator [Desulfomonilaceae bacterium]